MELDTTPPEYTVEILADEAVDSASVIIVEGPDAPGLLNAITSTLSASSLTVLHAGGKMIPSGIRDRFVVQSKGEALSPEQHAPLTSQLL